MENMDIIKQKHHLLYVLKQDIWRFASYYNDNHQESLKNFVLSLWQKLENSDYEKIQIEKTKNMLVKFGIL